MGNLFARKVSPLELEEMDYSSLEYWNEWHEVMAEAETKEADRIEALKPK